MFANIILTTAHLSKQIADQFKRRRSADSSDRYSATASAPSTYFYPCTPSAPSMRRTSSLPTGCRAHTQHMHAVPACPSGAAAGAQPMRRMPMGRGTALQHHTVLPPFSEARQHVFARAEPDRGSMAALEAAMGTINGILGAHNKLRQGKGRNSNQQGSGGAAGQQKQGAAAAGPSKLISFSAKAASTVPVKEFLQQPQPDQQQQQQQQPPQPQELQQPVAQLGISPAAGSSNGGSHIGDVQPHKQQEQHQEHEQLDKHQKQRHKQPSWLRGMLGHQTKQPASSSSSSSSSKGRRHSKEQHQHPGHHPGHHSPLHPPPADAWTHSLQAYLSLPLEQYSVLDPRLINRLPPGINIEELLQKLLAAQKQKRAARQQQQQEQRQQAASSDNGSTGSSGSSQTSLEPKMRPLEREQQRGDGSAQSDQQLAGKGSSGTDGSSGSEGGSSSSNGSKGSPAVTAAVGDDAGASGTAALAAAGSADDAGVAALAAEAAARAAATEGGAGNAGGAFLLRVPMEELVGLDLEPLLVVTVDIDPAHGQVKFRASRLVIGDERFDSEFKVDLQATMSSRIIKPARLITHHTSNDAAGAADADVSATGTASNSSSSTGGTSTSSSNGSSNGSNSSSSSAHGSSNVAVLEQAPAAPAAAAAAAAPAAAQPAEETTSFGGTAAATGAGVAIAMAPAQQQQEHQLQQDQQQQQQQQQQEDHLQEQQQLTWQRTSVLSCKVQLSLTLRLPHPLSIVPGPLLSTTASLVAKLAMQSLLPSFLELLATDYGRWASGSSRAAPVGSLVAAGKEHLKHR